MKPIPFPSKTSPWRVEVPGRYFADRKRKAKYFPTQAAAEKFIQKLKIEGRAALDQSRRQPNEDAFGIAVREFAKMYDGDVSKVYAAHEKLQKLQNIRPATVREAIEAFQAWQQTQIGEELAKSTVTQYRHRLVKLIRKFERVQLADLTTVALREFFDETTGDPRSIYSSVHKFLEWAVKYNYLWENPIDPIKAKEVGEYGVNNDYYPVETFRRMLMIAAGLEPVKPGGQTTREFLGLLPWFVLSGFLGLRSCEARRENREADSIRWTDLHFDAEIPYVEVRAQTAKKTKRESDLRYIETAHYLDAAKAWLSIVQPNGPYIVRWTKRQIQELKREFKKATKIGFIYNGFRNSFATYGLTFNGLQGLGKLALEMGDSEGICKRHYTRSIAPGSGRAWFNLRPESNVIPMPGAAAAA